ncbi:MAG: hypothetical protein ACXACY_23530 [Candidatus Hodarchaeales archaeon]|jgi:hypothetical protein
MNKEGQRHVQAKEEESIICPTCLLEQFEDHDFCVKCGAPLSSISTISPYEASLAQGDMYRTAIKEPKNAISIIGFYVLFLPQLAFITLMSLSFTSVESWAFLLFIVPQLIIVYILFRMTRNYIIGRNKKET